MRTELITIGALVGIFSAQAATASRSSDVEKSQDNTAVYGSETFSSECEKKAAALNQIFENDYAALLNALSGIGCTISNTSDLSLMQLSTQEGHPEQMK